jgi:predicted ArsR family transcriptional regulator
MHHANGVLMDRKEFIKAGCSCGILSLINAQQSLGQNQDEQSKKEHIPQEMSQEQVISLLKFIEDTQCDSIRESIFGQLGYECFYSRNLDQWVETYKDNVQEFLDRVNIHHKSKYWESLEYDAERSVLKLTGQKVMGCACAFSACSQPPKSLCHYCCKRFQEELFGTLFGKKVLVEITHSFLFGDDRCNTLIHIA